MKEETVVITSRENSAKAFREELAKLQQQEMSVIEQTTTSPEPEQKEEEVNETSEETEITTDDNSQLNNEAKTEAEEEQPHIPRKRLNQEIEKRKALEEQLQAEREEKIRFQTELDMYNRALEQLKSNDKTEKESDPEIDPLDSEAHRFYMKKIKELEDKLEGTSTKLQQTEYQKNFEHILNKHQEEFSKKNPDFNDAYNYLLKAEMENTKMFYDSQQEAQQAVLQRLAQVSAISLQKNQNAAETLYKMAKNYGYTPKAKTGVNSTPNLNAIETNMKKSRSIDDIPSVPLHPGSGSQNFAKLENFDRLMNKNGRGVDKDAFHKALARLKKGG